MVPSTSRSTSVCIRCVICETIHLPSLIVMRVSQRNKRLLHCMWPFICTCFARPQHSFISDCYLFIPARFWLLSLYPSINKKLAKNPKRINT